MDLHKLEQETAVKNQCLKCGAINGGKSKHKWFIASGKKCCGHCGTVKKA